MKRFLLKFNPNYATWNKELDLDYLHTPGSIEQSFAVPYLSNSDSFHVMQLFETCITTTTNGILIFIIFSELFYFIYFDILFGK